MANISGRQGGIPIFLNSDIIFNSGNVEYSTSDNAIFKSAYPSFSNPRNSGLINSQGFSNLNPCYIDGHECEIIIDSTGIHITITDIDITHENTVILHKESLVQPHSINDSNNGVVIIMMGTNGTWTSADDYVAQYKKCISNIASGKYIFISQFDVHFTNDGTYETYAAAQANKISSLKEIEEKMFDEFGNRFLNMREELVNNGIRYAIEGGYFASTALDSVNNIDAMEKGMFLLVTIIL